MEEPRNLGDMTEFFSHLDSAVWNSEVLVIAIASKLNWVH